MKKAYKFLPHLLIAISLLSSGSVFAFDRQAVHEKRLVGLDLDSRRSLGFVDRPILDPFSSLSAGDITISESTAPARFVQDRVSLAVLSSGEWLALWQDEREGVSKLYLQRISASGVAAGGNLMIAGSATGRRFVDPIIRIDSLDRVYLFYRDQTAGLVFGARFMQDLSVDLPTFLVNDTTGQAFAGPFDCDVTSGGRMVVTWENTSASGQTIEYRLFDPFGASIGGPSTAHSDISAVNRWVPSAAFSDGGDFVIAWEDYRNGVADIYARQFAGSGAPIGSDIAIVGPPESQSDQFAPSVSKLSGGQFVIGWTDKRLGQEVYVQRLDITAGLVGMNVRASDGDTLTNKWDVTVQSDGISSLDIFWSRTGNPGIIANRPYDSALVPLTSVSVVNQSTTGQRWGPSVARSSSGEKGVAWVEVVDNPDIHFTTMLTPPPSGELLLNDDKTGAHSTEPSVIATTNWRNLVAFRDRRTDGGDVYVQVVNNAGSLEGVNLRVNEDSGNAVQAEPALAKSGSQALIIWVDSRDLPGQSGQRIFGRYCSLIGQMAGGEFLISDSGQLAVKQGPVAALSLSGSGLVAWLDERGGNPQVYGKWIDTGGVPHGNDILFSNPAVDKQIVYLSIDTDGSDNSYLLWLDSGGASSVVRMRSFRPDGTALGSFDWTPNLAGVTLLEASAGVTASGDVVIAWTGSDGFTRNLYVSQVSSAGIETGSPTVIDDHVDALPSVPEISVSNNDYIALIWQDNRVGRPLLYYQVLDPSLGPMLANQPVATTPPEFMSAPAVYAENGRAWFSWVDNRAEGLNVQASVVIYEPTDVDDGDGGTLPESYSLGQNYPNPFNPSTTIEYSLPKKTHVRFEVFDILGRRVRVLRDQMQAAGKYVIGWDGRDENGQKSASGVYLYRLSTDDFSSQRKMVLLK